MGRRRRRKNKPKPKTNNEMQNRRDFYQERPHYIKPEDLELAGEVSEFRKMFLSNNENVTFSLNYLEGPSPLRTDPTRYRELNNIQRELRYFRCPPEVTIGHLKKLLKAKYELRGNSYRVDMFFREDALNDDYSLIDISYIFLWNAKDNISLTFKVYEGPIKRRRRRYFGGVEQLPACFTPFSILQSKLGVLANSMTEDNISEERRHLRSDIEKKKREIEARIEAERRLSERELRSHYEKRKEKEREKEKGKDNKKNEGKKRDKHDDKKKDKKKNQEEKKKKKEGRCHDEKRKEKDDDDKDEKRKDKETKEEKNTETEIKKAGDKRKWEGEPEGSRKREKREEIKENDVDMKEEKEVNEDGREKTMTGEATSTTASEADSTQTSTLFQPPVSTSGSDSASDQAQTSTSAEQGSATASAEQDSATTSATEAASGSSTLEPTSTTAAENEQKTEEAEVKANENTISSHENRATPPKDSGDTEIQLQISESGVMITSPVESSKDVIRTVEERGCGRVTRQSSTTGAVFRLEGVGNRETRKRRSNSKSVEGSSNEPKRKGGVKSSKTYKTIFRSANLWNPTISREKLRSNFLKNNEQSNKPPKFFKMRSKLRSSTNPSSDEKPTQEPALKENKEEEELPQHEIEKEEALVEPEAAHVAIRDADEAKRMEENKRQFEGEEKKQNEEGNKMETTPTDNNTALKGDPKTFEPLINEGRCSVIVTASAPNLPTNLKGDPKTFGLLDKDDKCSTIIGASAPNLPNNLKGDLKNFGALDKEDRCATIIGANTPNLLTNPFIPNSNHFLFSDVTLPTDSGNYSKSAESKLDKSLLGKAVPGIGALGGAGLGVGGGIGTGTFHNPVANGGSYSPMCFLDPSRFVYPYQTYPVTDANAFLAGSHLPAFGNMAGFGPVTGFHASLPPSINNLSSPHQNVQVVSLVQKKNKDDSTKERIKSCDDALYQSKVEERGLRKRRRVAETEVTDFLKKEASGKGMQMEVDEEKDEDDEKMLFPAKRKRDEKGSRDNENKEKPKDDKLENEKEKGDKTMDDEGPA